MNSDNYFGDGEIAGCAVLISERSHYIIDGRLL